MKMTSKQMAAQVEFTPTQAERKTQHQRILDYIAQFGSITPMAAIHAFGCTKLATRIGEIEGLCGYKFQRQPEKVYTRLGAKTRVMRYSIPEGMTVNDFRTLVRYGKRFEKINAGRA